MAFGEYFRSLRKEKRFTQEEVALKIGKSKMLLVELRQAEMVLLLTMILKQLRLFLVCL